jgi:hypothetical protein
LKKSVTSSQGTHQWDSKVRSSSRVEAGLQVELVWLGKFSVLHTGWKVIKDRREGTNGGRHVLGIFLKKSRGR